MILANRSAAQAAFGARASRPVKASRARLACRAEVPAKADRNATTPGPVKLYVGASESTVAYLDGSLPGDYGFDPLNLLDPVNKGGFVEPRWLTYSEVIHCRFAMLGAAGCIAPEILGAMGVIPRETALPWFRTGVIPPAGAFDNYWADPYTIFFVEVVAMQFAELRRLQDFRYPGSMGEQYFLGLESIFKGSGNPAYPGGPFFNLFNLGKTPAELDKLKRREIENGRLAMIAMLGYGAQATITRVGPFQNLVDHVSDPVHNNILTNFGKVFGEL